MTVLARPEPEVSITIARDPALVRTVRLIAAAVARRADCEDALIEEIRLAVGEACAVMIGAQVEGRSRVGGDPDGAEDARVQVRLRSREGFSATVSGAVNETDSQFEGMGLEPWALVRGLCQELEVVHDGEETVLTMSWRR